MFSSRISRVAPRVSSSTAPAPPTNRATACLASKPTRHPHQRRHSSSKASCPPNSSSSSSSSTKTAPVAKSAAASSTAEAPSQPTTEAPSQPTLRTSKKTAKDRRSTQEKLGKQKEEDVAQFAALPTVPRVQHLKPEEFGLSWFFSLHRPLSLTNPLPRPASEATFSAIFESSTQNDSWADGNSAERRPEDVIYALGQTIEAIESGTASAQNDVVHIDVLQESQSNSDTIRHLDGAPRPRIPTLEEIVAQSRPFAAPPPPQPFDTKPKQEKKRASRQIKQATPKQQSYTTTIVVTESMFPDGQKTYAASASPIVRLPDPVFEEGAEQDITRAPSAWTPMRKRPRPRFFTSSEIRTLRRHGLSPDPSSVRRLPGRQQSTMRLISVKRQRRLKMKKHKHKKLMRRTRNLRRRLEKK